MKMKKKILSIALCVALCFGMVLPAFAAGTVEAEYTGQDANKDVNITISGDVVHVYYVDIQFTNPTFTYSSGSKWNPDNYQYEPSTAATWMGEGIVKIINHSDRSVKYKVESVNVVATYGPLNIEVTNAEGEIDQCNVGDAKDSHNATATFKVTGTPTVSEINAQKLGEIKVTIKQ